MDITGLVVLIVAILLLALILFFARRSSNMQSNWWQKTLLFVLVFVFSIIVVPFLTISLIVMAILLTGDDGTGAGLIAPSIGVPLGLVLAIVPPLVLFGSLKGWNGDDRY